MDRGTWQSIDQGVARVGHNLEAKLPLLLLLELEPLCVFKNNKVAFQINKGKMTYSIKMLGKLVN